MELLFMGCAIMAFVCWRLSIIHGTQQKIWLALADHEERIKGIKPWKI